MPSPVDIAEQIREYVQEGLPSLPPFLRLWAINHLVVPSVLEVETQQVSLGRKQVWVVTDTSANCRIVFDVTTGLFGLTFTDSEGRHWYDEASASFAECVLQL